MIGTNQEPLEFWKAFRHGLFDFSFKLKYFSKVVLAFHLFASA